MPIKCFLAHTCEPNFYQFFRSALKAKGGNWTEANIDKWLKSPADYAPGM